MTPTTQAPAPIDATLTLGDPAPNLPAVVTDATPALIDTDNDPWAGYDHGDWTGDKASSRIPFFELNRKFGHGFVDSETGEMSTELIFIWLATMRSRAQWNKSFDERDPDNPAPDCRSFDGLTSDPASPDRKQVDCATCPFAKFGPNGEAPKCRESFEVMAFLPDNAIGEGRLTRFRFGGLAVGPTRDYRSSFDLRIPKIPTFSKVTKVALLTADTVNGKFLEPRFSRATEGDLRKHLGPLYEIQTGENEIVELTPQQVSPILAERDRRRAAWLADIADSVVTGETGDGDVGGNASSGASGESYLLDDGSEF